TSFFAFADTVVARGYLGGHEFHGWMGMKFQSRANDQPSQIVMHVLLLDEEASAQQEALGIVGVNLCYGAFFLSHVPEELVESLLDNLTTRRIEIDMLEFSGIEFRNVDNRIMALKLVQLGLSGAAMFGPNREVLQPSDMLHNKAVLVERGRLLKNDLKIYVYPLQRSPTDELQTIQTVKVKDDLQPLYDYLVRRGSFVQLDNYNPKYLAIFSRDVLKRIATGDESWDEMVLP